MTVKKTPEDLHSGHEEIINKKIAEIAEIAEDIPGVVIIHDVQTQNVRYMSQKGCKLLGVTLKELQDMGTEYYDRFFNPEDSREYVPKIIELLRTNTDQPISFFQQVRFAKYEDWQWHISATKILLRDKKGVPLLLITTALYIDPLHHITAKVARLLEENNFLRRHYHQFSKLGKRETEVLKHMSLGKTSTEISEELYISVATVDTHRRNIKRKLNVNSSYELSQYARAFDLI